MQNGYSQHNGRVIIFPRRDNLQPQRLRWLLTLLFSERQHLIIQICITPCQINKQITIHNYTSFGFPYLYHAIAITCVKHIMDQCYFSCDYPVLVSYGYWSWWFSVSVSRFVGTSFIKTFYQFICKNVTQLTVEPLPFKLTNVRHYSDRHINSHHSKC